MAPRTSLALLPTLILLASPAAWAQEVPGEGDLVISEIVIAPTSGSREWFEVQNVSGQDLELEGCLLAEGHFNDEKSWTGHDDTVDESVIVPAGERAVLMYSTSTDNDPLCVAYEDEALSTCLLESTWRYGSLGFNNSDAETLSITCDGVLVDEIGFDWGEFSGDCPDTAGANCSVNLDPSLIDAASNDDLLNWCVPWESPLTWDHAGSPSVSTPGEANLCHAQVPWCGAGDVVISELMIAPPDGYDEWIELFGAGAEGCNVGGCQLLAGPSADPFYEPSEKDDWDWDTVLIEAAYDLLMVEPGDYALLARNDDWITGDGTGGDDIASDFSYSGISLPNSDAECLHLLCGDTVIDSAPLDWPSLASFCPDGNCSANLSANAQDATSNDDISAWCTPPTDSTFVNPSGETIRATPGTEGVCVELRWPDQGDVIFTELIASPQGGVSEFMELLNTTSDELDLSFCELRKHRLDDAGEVDGDSLKSYLIGEDGVDLTLAPDAIQIMAYKDCLFSTAEDTADTGAATADCDQGEYLYGTIQISGDEEEHISLVCPDGEGGETVVDAVAINFSVEGVRDGHSIMLDPDLANATDNDMASAWCEAAFSQKIDLVSDDIEDCNYGTPGSLDPCLVDVPEPLQPVCRCSSQQRPAGWLGLVLFTLGAVFMGRRREQRR